MNLLTEILVGTCCLLFLFVFIFYEGCVRSIVRIVKDEWGKP
jgi:hypothetical protein